MEVIKVKTNSSLYIPPEYQSELQVELKKYGYAIEDNIWEIPNGVIGNIATNSLTIEIHPSIEYLTFFDYFNLLELTNFKDTTANLDFSANYESENIAQAILLAFKRELINILKNGFPRKYTPTQQRGEFIKGQIDFVGSFTNILNGIELPILSQVDELSYSYEEIVEINVAYKKFKSMTKERILDFEKISKHVKPVKYDKKRYLKHKNFHKLSLCYNLAYLINNNLNGLERGKSQSLSFLLNSNIVYEDFITAYIKQLFPNEVFVAKEKHIAAKTEDSQEIIIEPDLIHKSTFKVVLDMKNKNYFKGIKASDYHQMISYLSSIQSKTAVLIYPVASDIISEQVFNPSHNQTLRITRIPVNIRKLNPKLFTDKISTYLYFD